MNTKAVRNVRKLERPRPLKLSTDGSLRSPISPPADTSVFKKINTDNILQDLESLHISINNGNFDESTVSTITKVCNQLKSKGYELEITFKEQVDRYFVTLRNASREDRLDMASRLRLLEVIELKAMGWKNNENLSNYYTKKLMDLENTDKISSTPSATTSTYFQPQTQHTVTNVGIALAPGEILRSSGKFAKPTKIAGKNYFKDEIVIRNSDSGKVMGIKGRRVHMIEELSDTIISFQRVNPGARDRLVQITGPTEEAIGHAKLLIEDTIRRNASPIREKVEQADMEDEGSESSASLSSLCEDSEVQGFSMMKKQLAHSFSMSDASIGEYCFNVQVGQDNIRVLGTKLDLVKTARLVLEEYFAGQAELLEKEKHYEVLVAPTLDSATSCSSSSVHSNSITRLESSKQTSQKTFGIPSSSWLCNGKRERSGNSPNSSSEEETYKAGEVDSSNGESCIRDIPDLPHDPSSKRPVSDPVQFSGYHYETLLRPVPCTSENIPSSPEVSSLNILKQTFLPSYPVKEPEQAKISPMLQGVSINTQHSHFSKLCDTSEESNVSAPSPSFIPGTGRITYSREFLLTCARSPYSYRQPRDFLQIVKNIPFIQREKSSVFDSKSSPESSATESKDIAESSAENQKGES